MIVTAAVVYLVPRAASNASVAAEDSGEPVEVPTEDEFGWEKDSTVADRAQAGLTVDVCRQHMVAGEK